MVIFMYILVNSGEDGVYRGTIEEIANYADLPEDEVRFIIDKNLCVEWVDGGLEIHNHSSYNLSMRKVKEEEEEDDDDELELSSEIPRDKYARKHVVSLSPVEKKFAESMMLFYPNVASVKTPLSLAEYNILCKYVADTGNLSIACANELLIDVLQQMDSSPTLKKRTDAYKTVRNWLTMIFRNRQFSFDYYRNINIEARKNEREALKQARSRT